MSIPARCPICKTVLEFPGNPSGDPVRCPVCNSRFVIEGTSIAHIKYTDYYKLLDVAPDIGEEGLKKAIRAKILKCHPDRNPDDPTAAGRLRDIVQAKEILSDRNKREAFDAAYYAEPLPVWKGYHKPEQNYRTASNTGREDISNGVRFQNVRNHASHSETSSGYNDINHLVDEIDVIFMQAGVPINLRGRGASGHYSRTRRIWQATGLTIGALTGLIFGLLYGSIMGALIMMLLGGVIGWVLTSYPGGLLVLVFFTARMFIASLVIALAASKANTGVWMPHEFGLVMKILHVATTVGAVGFGLWWIGMSTFQMREPFYVHHTAHRQAALGAWLGSLWALFIIVVFNSSYFELQSVIGWWFLFYSMYLLIDVIIFSRTWVFVYE